MTERIQKILSAVGFCSRRRAEELIQQHKVTLNGHPATLGDKMDPRKDVVAVEGVRVHVEERHDRHYYLLNKPRGCVTTLSDEHDRKCVADLMSDVDARLFPVGRLDKDSEGLLIMTDDGALANMVMHPSREVSKLYRVSVSPAASEEQLIMLVEGVQSDGETLRAAGVRVTGEESEKSVLELTLKEGKNREIRRMCEAAGLEVTRLKRTAIGPIRLGSLRAGEYREMTKQEITALRNACEKKK